MARPGFVKITFGSGLVGVLYAGQVGSRLGSAVMGALEEIGADLGSALVALDFDGTLAPIVDRPEHAVALPAAVDALHALAPHLRALAVITGRPAAFVADQLGLDRLAARVVVLGGYGRERWEAGALDAPPPSAQVRRALPDVQALVAAAPPGTCLEDKGAGLAVHVRQTAEPAVALAEIRPRVLAVARAHGLVVEPGRLVLELRAPGTDKGAALRALVAELRPRAVLFAGDDLGDLAAFDVVDALPAEGIAGVTVCSGSDEVREVAERADLVVNGPEGVARLLRALAGRAERG